jgi:chorismate mutase
MDDSDPRKAEAIDRLRQEIDEIDSRLLELFNRRARCVVEIGHIKRAGNMPLYQPDRERQIFDRAEAANPGPLSNRAIRRLFERILDESRSVERHVMEPAAKDPAANAAGTEEGGER